VGAGQVRDRAEDALTPEDLVRERGDVGHVDPGTDDSSALGYGLQRGRNELAGRGEDDRRVELLGRRARAGPLGAQRAGERLRASVALSRHCEDTAAFPQRDLRDDVGRRAEAVEAEPPAFAGESQRPEADQAGAQERGRLEIAVIRWDAEAEPLVRDNPLGVAAVEVVPREVGGVAEVLAAGRAVAACAVGPPEPR